jgi:hypothetical protein
MSSHTSPCDHMTLFVAKSSPERTWVSRRVTGRMTVRRLVNVNPGRPKTSSIAAPKKLQHHCLWSPKSESKSFFFLKRAHGVKRAIQEAGEGGGAAAPARRAEEVIPKVARVVPRSRLASRRLEHRERRGKPSRRACTPWTGGPFTVVRRARVPRPPPSVRWSQVGVSASHI